VYGGWNEDVDWCVVNDAKEPASVSLLFGQQAFTQRYDDPTQSSVSSSEPYAPRMMGAAL
jgi:hypothetical protein